MEARDLVMGIVLMACVCAFAPAASGQPAVTADQVGCIPIGDNAVAWARVENNQPETEVRLYFRRLNDTVEDLYYMVMIADGGGRYWGVFPRPRDVEMDRHEITAEREAWAKWWRAKDESQRRNPDGRLNDNLIRERASRGKTIERHWMYRLDDDQFQQWLERQQNEPTEYFVTVNDAEGRELARSETMVTEVHDDCRVELTREQRGVADNLVLGETAPWQVGEDPFHWMCSGVVTRVDTSGVLRADSRCRTCVPCPVLGGINEIIREPGRRGVSPYRY